MSVLSGQIKLMKQEVEALSDEYQSILMQISLLQSQAHKLRGKVKGMRVEIDKMDRLEKGGFF